MSKSEKDIATVRRLCDARATFTLEDFQSTLASDCYYVNMPHPGDPRIGPDAAFQRLNRYNKNGWRVDLETLNISAQGDVILAERMEIFYAPGAATGFALPVMGSFKMKDGKIAQWRDYYDSAQTAPIQAAWAKLG